MVVKLRFAGEIACSNRGYRYSGCAKDAKAGDGYTQFGRALSELNIDIICANTPAVKGRVERANQTLQGLEHVVSAPRSPWQNPYVERVIGSIRRECTDHLIVTGEAHLRRMLGLYVSHYNEDRTHLSLGKDSPTVRPAQSRGSGVVVALPRVGGLHHRYERMAA